MSIGSTQNYCRFFEKKLVRVEQNRKVEKISYLWRRSQGTLTFFWEKIRMGGKEPLQKHISVSENLLYNIYFLLVKFSRVSYTDLHLCSFLLHFQVLIKYLKINVFYKNELHFRGKFFATALRHCLLLKASCSVTISPWLSFSRKIQTFLLLPPPTMCIPFSESHSFYWKPLFLFVSLCLKIN